MGRADPDARGDQELLEAEKELTRRNDELARRGRGLPWVRIDKEHSFDTDEGNEDAGRALRRPRVLVWIAAAG